MNNIKYFDDLISDIKDTNYLFIANYHEYIKNSKLDVYERCVLDVLRVYAGSNNSCFPGQTKIANHLGISRKKVNETLQSLENKGAILIINKKTDTNRKTTNTYIIAKINPDTGEFISSSLDKYRILKEEIQVVRERKND